MLTHGMTVNPNTGVKVLAIRKAEGQGSIRRDIGDELEFIELDGQVGDTFNYVTLENYGQLELIPIRIRKRGRTVID